MAAIQLTQENTKEMAARLREFLAAGGHAIRQSHAYEALAKTFGYRDWNTLAAQLAPSGTAPSEEGPARKPAMRLLIDRYALAAHGVTVNDIDAALKYDFPDLLTTRTQGEALSFEQLPARTLPAFTPPVISVAAPKPKTIPPGDLLECLRAIEEFPNIVMLQGEATTVQFSPERTADEVLVAVREAVKRLPAELRPIVVEKVDANKHPAFSQWRTDHAPYFVWEWESEPHFDAVTRLAWMVLKLDRDKRVRLRDVATLQILMPSNRDDLPPGPLRTRPVS